MVWPLPHIGPCLLSLLVLVCFLYCPIRTITILFSCLIFITGPSMWMATNFKNLFGEKNCTHRFFFWKRLCLPRNLLFATWPYQLLECVASKIFSLARAFGAYLNVHPELDSVYYGRSLEGGLAVQRLGEAHRWGSFEGSMRFNYFLLCWRGWLNQAVIFTHTQYVSLMPKFTIFLHKVIDDCSTVRDLLFQLK